MATLLDIVDYRTANRQLLDMALTDLESIWKTLNIYDGVETRLVLGQVLPELINTYGEAVALLAADRFEELRAYANVPIRYSAVLAPRKPNEQIFASMRWALTPIFREQNPAQAFDNLRGMTDRFIHAAGRDTTSYNVDRDPVDAAYARVPKGTETCAFCLTLASRGPVYGSKKSALYKANGDKYHDWCDCEPTPVWNGDRSTLPDDYDENKFLEIYNEAATGDLKTTLANIREQNPGVR